ncbi:MAG: hypothetical protein ACRC3G_05370, partial [Bacteroidales bacterium]
MKQKDLRFLSLQTPTIMHNSRCLFSLLILAITLMSCSKNYYDKINTAPTIHINTQLDSFKTSAKGLYPTYDIVIQGEDPNGNIAYWWTAVNDAELLFENNSVNGINQVIDSPKEKFEFSRTLSLRPTSNGMHIFKANMKDGLNTQSNTLEKHIYSFDNLPPVINVTYT